MKLGKKVAQFRQINSPALTGRVAFLTHILGDGRLSHRKASLSSSPWMCGAPQSRLSTLIRQINARNSAWICGRPPAERDFPRQ
jgi:hypothetical protein